MLACDVGNAGTRLKRCGENLKPLRLAPSPPTLRPRKHRDLTQRPLLSSLSRALLRPVAIATGKAAVTEGVLYANDGTFSWGSETPWDAQQSFRVVTIMLASD